MIPSREGAIVEQPRRSPSDLTAHPEQRSRHPRRGPERELADPGLRLGQHFLNSQRAATRAAFNPAALAWNQKPVRTSCFPASAEERSNIAVG